MVQRIKNIQNRSTQTRSAILGAVAALWESRAFDAITVADIAMAAGVAKGSVLAHFSEKQAILAQFLADALDKTSMALAADAGFASDQARVAGALVPILAYLLHDKALLRLLTAEGDDRQCVIILNPALAHLRETLRKGFADAGLVDPALCADVLMALVVQVVVSGHVATPEMARAELQRLAAILYR